MEMILSSFALKIIAIISMFYDHTLKSIPLGFPISLDFLIPGRLAFPIFAFLLVEGIEHTKSIPKYIFRIGVLAVISEFLYDFLFRNVILEFTDQNVLFELFLGLLILWLYKFLKEKNHGDFIPFALLIAVVISMALNLD